VVKLLFTPGELFEILAANPLWVGALVLGALIGAAGAALVPTELYEGVIREQMMSADRPIPDDLSSVAMFGRIAGTVGALVVGPLITMAMAGIVSMIFIFVLGDDGTFKQHLASVSHAFLIASLSTVVLLPLKIITGDLQIRLSIGTFMPFLGEGWLASALSWLDLFAIWAWVLVGLGASKIDRGRSWTSAAAVILGLVVVITFAITGIGALRS